MGLAARPVTVPADSAGIARGRHPPRTPMRRVHCQDLGGEMETLRLRGAWWPATCRRRGDCCARYDDAPVRAIGRLSIRREAAPSHASEPSVRSYDDTGALGRHRAWPRWTGLPTDPPRPEGPVLRSDPFPLTRRASSNIIATLPSRWPARRRIRQVLGRTWAAVRCHGRGSPAVPLGPGRRLHRPAGIAPGRGRFL